jgi:hypothetical protein
VVKMLIMPSAIACVKIVLAFAAAGFLAYSLFLIGY